MDEKLGSYFNAEPGRPPFISEKQIERQLEQRRKRRSLIWLSLAGLLWTLTLYAIAFGFGQRNAIWGVALLTAISASYICAGCFAGIVIKLRRVVL
jgi:hypothetical protein